MRTFLAIVSLQKVQKKIIQSKLNQSKTLFAKCWNWLHTLWSPLQSRPWIDDCASQKIGSRTNFQTNFSPHNSLSQNKFHIVHFFLTHAHGTKNKYLASVFHASCYSSDSFVTRLRVKVIHQACRRPMHTTNNNNHATGSQTHYPKLISSSCKDNASYINNNPHWAKLSQDYPKMLYCASDCRKLHRRQE